MPNGSDGCDSTGASRRASVAIARAKPPVKHMPTAPTPGPAAALVLVGGQGPEPVDHRRRLAGRPRGELAADARRDQRSRGRSRSSATGCRLGGVAARLRRTGAAARRCSRCRPPARRSRSTLGVIPGISAMTITAGPVPRRNTVAGLAVVRERRPLEVVERQRPPSARDRSVRRPCPPPPGRSASACSAPPSPGGMAATTAGGWRDLARRVEDLGFDTLTVADHLDDQLAVVPAMQAAADATVELRIGALVLCNDYRHPVVLAKEMATVDVLSGGRLEVGVGAGWMRTDYEAAGIPLDAPGHPDRPARRGARRRRGVVGRRPAAVTRRPLPRRRPRRAAEAAAVAAAAVAARRRGAPDARPRRPAGRHRRHQRLARQGRHRRRRRTRRHRGGDGPEARLDPRRRRRPLRRPRTARAGAHGRPDRRPRRHRRGDRSRCSASRPPRPSSRPTPWPDQPTRWPRTCSRNRERWGISYIGVSVDALDAMAPVVARLKGT